MDEETYSIWWPLHIRAAQGERLTAEEQATYAAGCALLDAEETLPNGLENLRQAQERTRQLEAERVRLQADYDALRAEIAALETHLSEPVRRLLEV